MATLEQIWIFPIKSLDGVSLSIAEIAPGGSLVGDREFAIVDGSGRWVNGKRTAQVHRLRSVYDLSERRVQLAIADSNSVQSFHLEGDRKALEAWLSDYFGFTVGLQQDRATGFPDDPGSPGPTVITEATLSQVASWFDGMDLLSARRRFRTNLELSGVPAFWEEQLYGSATETIPFALGEVQMEGVNPCQRCIVPTRDGESGAAIAGFQKRFSHQRQATLPDWARRDRFNHFYRLAVNTRISASESGKMLRIGDECRLAPSL
jgi:uncharacterized protein